ncbi:MAG: pentapeptide repeat-containing protein [Pirellulaceae bacterium]
MNRADALRLLQDGLSGITRWNAERASGQPIADLSGIQLSGVKLCHRDPTTRQRVAADLSDVRLVDARFDGADLSRVNLENADLSGASLTGARLTRARLVRATLARADLSNATLRGAGLRLADLWRTRCVEADLRDAVLAKSTLASTDLTGADLRGATLYEALAVRTNFLGAKLDRAYLRRCRFVGANLTNATIEGARVDGMTLDDLAGLPNAPSELRSGDRRISGDEARHFFHKEFSVELFLTERLTERELGAYHFHLDELHSRDSALGVAFVGCRSEADGTVLRFQVAIAMRSIERYLIYWLRFAGTRWQIGARRRRSSRLGSDRKRWLPWPARKPRSRPADGSLRAAWQPLSKDSIKRG